MLRDYQIDICSRVSEAFEHHRSVMVQMPTGTGKTMVLAELVKQLMMKDEGVRILIVAHRRELIEQIKATIKRMKMDSRNITVESIQTISRRIATIEFAPSLVVIDEAHHALAKTYKMMWETWPDAKFLGLTATPCRLNGKGFTDLFDVLVQSWDIPAFIKEKWLSTYDFVSIKADSRTQQLISSLKKRGADGDYQVKEMDAVLNKRPSIERLYNSVMEYAHNRKGFVYAININHARSIAEYYQSQGVHAVAIDSHTPVKERELLISSFRSGELQVLVNVDIFSEGFDCPDVEFIQLARPTLSLAKYLQMVGRGLRPSKGKKNCMIIDNVGLYRVFGLPSQIWDWKSAFEGRMKMREERLKSKDERLKSKDNHSSLINNQKIDTEMYLVVSHEQLDATFEQHTEDGRMMKVRNDLLSGKWGRVKRIDRQLVELLESKDDVHTYVDLVNMNFFKGTKDDKPRVVKLGGFEFIRNGNIILSRTRKVLLLPRSTICTLTMSFYSEFQGFDFKETCLAFEYGKWQNGTKRIIFLHDDSNEYYWSSSRLSDNSIVIMDADGNYYLKAEGQPRMFLGRTDTNEEREAMKAKITEVETAAKKKKESEKNKPRREFEIIGTVSPYRLGQKWGIRDSKGHIIVPPIYRKIKNEHNFFSFEDLPLHWGVMDKFGKVLVEPKHDKVEITPDGKAILTSITGKQTVINLKSPQK
ncbi:MAG: DEAD/DEAH box helicase [Prevotella sp.]|nr:DEAD/DEAH box helicase [Prevotella sp.]